MKRLSVKFKKKLPLLCLTGLLAACAPALFSPQALSMPQTPPSPLYLAVTNLNDFPSNSAEKQLLQECIDVASNNAGHYLNVLKLVEKMYQYERSYWTDPSESRRQDVLKKMRSQKEGMLKEKQGIKKLPDSTLKKLRQQKSLDYTDFSHWIWYNYSQYISLEIESADNLIIKLNDRSSVKPSNENRQTCLYENTLNQQMLELHLASNYLILNETFSNISPKHMTSLIGQFSPSVPKRYRSTFAWTTDNEAFKDRENLILNEMNKIKDEEARIVARERRKLERDMQKLREMEKSK